jgi:hypothetical protein
MNDTQRAAMEQALVYLERSVNNYPIGHALSRQSHEETITALRAALAETAEPVGWTPREIELIDGMIEVQLQHAQRCDGIANRTMAEKQKAWDMERVALLQKIKATPQPPAPALDYKPLTDPHDHPEPHSYKWTQQEMDYINRRVAAAIAAHEAKKGGAA